MTARGNMKDKLIHITSKSCPKCKGIRFRYHPPNERQIYVVGKYECLYCGWQSGVNGEINSEVK